MAPASLVDPVDPGAVHHRNNGRRRTGTPGLVVPHRRERGVLDAVGDHPSRDAGATCRDAHVRARRRARQRARRPLGCGGHRDGHRRDHRHRRCTHGRGCRARRTARRGVRQRILVRRRTALAATTADRDTRRAHPPRVDAVRRRRGKRPAVAARPPVDQRSHRHRGRPADRGAHRSRTAPVVATMGGVRARRIRAARSPRLARTGAVPACRRHRARAGRSRHTRARPHRRGRGARVAGRLRGAIRRCPHHPRGQSPAHACDSPCAHPRVGRCALES